MPNGGLGGLATWLNGPLRLTMSLTCPEPFGVPFGVICGLPALWALQTACECAPLTVAEKTRMTKSSELHLLGGRRVLGHPTGPRA
jgi:hypothetical protein